MSKVCEVDARSLRGADGDFFLALRAAELGACVAVLAKFLVLEVSGSQNAAMMLRGRGEMREMCECVDVFRNVFDFVLSSYPFQGVSTFKPPARGSEGDPSPFHRFPEMRSQICESMTQYSFPKLHA